MQMLKTTVGFLAATLAVTGGCIGPAGDQAAAPCSEIRETYRIRHVYMPRTQLEAETVGADFDNDGRRENALGSAAVRMHQLANTFDPTESIAAQLTRTPWILSITRCLPGPSAAATTGAPASPDAVNAADTPPAIAEITFQHAPPTHAEPNAVTSESPPIRARIAGNSLLGKGGGVEIPVAWLGDARGASTTAAWLPAFRVSLSLRRAGSVVAGALAVTLDVDQARRALAVPLADFLTHAPAAALARSLVDRDHDGIVTVDELLADPGFARFTAADVFEQHADGVAPAISLGFGFVAEASEVERAPAS